MRGKFALLLTTAFASGLAGCVANPYVPGTPGARQLRDRAIASLKQGVCYPHVPLVRCQAIEALRVAAPDEGLAWIRTALRDDSAVVRFAACAALGELRDGASRARFAAALEDPDSSVRAAAAFALHRIGDATHTHRLADYLLDHADPTVRRNAATLLGRLGEKGAVKLLARVMNDSDEGLRLQALESMALLGNQEAQQQLMFMSHSGLGAREAFAVNALGELEDPDLAELFAYKLKTAGHWETKLAAARALGRLGNRDGFKVAAQCLIFDRPSRDPEVIRDDPPESQIVRIRSVAALALGAIGDPAALPRLARTIEEPYDPRVELAGALAVLEILHDDAESVLRRDRDAALTTAAGRD